MDKIQWNLFNLIVVCLGNGVALIRQCSFTIKNAVGITLMYVPPILALGFGAIWDVTTEVTMHRNSEENNVNKRLWDATLRGVYVNKRRTLFW